MQFNLICHIKKESKKENCVKYGALPKVVISTSPLPNLQARNGSQQSYNQLLPKMPACNDAHNKNKISFSSCPLEPSCTNARKHTNYFKYFVTDVHVTTVFVKN